MRGAKCPPGCTCGKHQGTRFLDPGSLKLCKGCGMTKPLSDFGISRQATEKKNKSYRTICRACQSAASQEWYRRPGNRERSLKNARRTQVKRAYGITVEEYDDLLARQDSGCAICNGREHALEYRLSTRRDVCAASCAIGATWGSGCSGKILTF